MANGKMAVARARTAASLPAWSVASQRVVVLPSRTAAGLTALGLTVVAGACGGPSSQVAKDVSRPGGRGDGGDSLFRGANLGKALARVRGRVGPAAPVTSFKLEAGAITLVAQKGSAPESVVVTKHLDLTHVPAPPTADQPPIALSQLDPAAPERIATAIGRRTGAGLKDIDYFAVDREPGSSTPRWLVYLRQGRGTFAASLSGADVRPASATSAAPAPTAPTTPLAPPPATSTPTTSTPTTPTPPKTASPSPHPMPPNCLRLRPSERRSVPECAKPTRR